MNYRVIRPFIAREDCKEYKAGDTFACLDPARAQILIDKKYIAESEAKEPEPEKPQPKAKAVASKRATKKKA